MQHGGSDARYIWIFQIFYARRIFNSRDKAWDKICIFWGEVAGGGIFWGQTLTGGFSEKWMRVRGHWASTQKALNVNKKRWFFYIIDNLPHLHQRDSIEVGQVGTSNIGYTQEHLNLRLSGRNKIPNFEWAFYRMFLSLLGENPKTKLSILKEPAKFDTFEIFLQTLNGS